MKDIMSVETVEGAADKALANPLEDLMSGYRLPNQDSFLDPFSLDRGAGQKNDMLHPLVLVSREKPHSPPRKPDAVTADGARLWHDGSGRVECLKTHSGQIFKFDYDKGGRIKEVLEPDGSILMRNGSQDAWTRTNTRGQSHEFKGQVAVQADGSVIYKGRDGQDTVFSGSGCVAECRLVDGKLLLTKLSDAHGASMSFSYDSEGKPFAIEDDRGWWLTRGTDGNWYRSRPGRPGDDYLPIKIERDGQTGDVIIADSGMTARVGVRGVEVRQRT